MAAPSRMSSELLNSMQQILSGYRGGNINDVMRHLSLQDPAVLEPLMDAIAKENSKVDLSTFNYRDLPVKPQAFWVVQLAHMGFQDRNGRMSDHEYPGSLPCFQIVIYDDRGTYRVAEACLEAGLPSSEFVLQSIKQAMASPLPPLRAELPGFLLVARKLRGHLPGLKQFLDSLPVPFSWRLETEEEEEEVASGVHTENVKGVAKGMRDAEAEKELGNKAFVRKDRNTAIKHYTEAIQSLIDALTQNPTDAQTKKIKTMLAVCCANQAASWLLPGDGQSAQKALEDAEKAIEWDDTYAKAYYRKAKAQQFLSRGSDAIDTLAVALSRPPLAADKGLNDALVEMYGGFPQTADDLLKFCMDKFKNAEGDQRAREIVEFRRRADAQLKAVIGPEASVETL